MAQQVLALCGACYVWGSVALQLHVRVCCTDSVLVWCTARCTLVTDLGPVFEGLNCMQYCQCHSVGQCVVLVYHW